VKNQLDIHIFIEFGHGTATMNKIVALLNSMGGNKVKKEGTKSSILLIQL
jgi:hypothetical protein